MSRWHQALETTLNVRPGEGQALSLLVFRSFFAGLFYVFFETAASALFLSTFDVESLPYVYIATAAVATATGLLYARCERLLTPSRLMQGTLGFVLASVLGLTLSYFLAPGRWLFAALMVWKDVLWMLMAMEFWGLAGCLFNVRQGKRLFAVAASGALVAGLIGGFMVAGIVKIAAIGGLLVASTSAAALTFAIGIHLTRRFSQRLSLAEEDPAEASEPESLLSMLRRPYLQLFFGITVISLLAYYLLDYAFYESVEARMPGEAELAIFFGYFYAFTNLVNLLTSGLLSGRLLTRFGVGMTLSMVPCAVFLGASMASGAALLGLPALLFFWLLVATKLCHEVLREAFEEPTLRILYQPLRARERLAVQAKRESIVEPIGTGVCGVLLLIVTSLLSANAMHLLIALLPLCAVWVLLSGRLREAYVRMLTTTLSKRRMERASAAPLNAISRAILERGLKSPQPVEVIYYFHLLDEMGHPRLNEFFLEALGHGREDVRLDALEQVEHRGLSEAAPILNRLLSSELSPRVRGSLLRALCSVADDDALEPPFSSLLDRDRDARLGSVVGLLRRGGIDGVVAAGMRLNEHLASSDPAARRFAPDALGEARISNFYRPLLLLLEDEDDTVRRASAQPAGRLRNPGLLPALVTLLSDSRVREAASTALVDFGQTALPELERVLRAQGPEWQARKRLIRVLARIGGDDALALVCSQLDHWDWAVRSVAYEALELSGYRARGAGSKQIRTGLLREAERATWCWRAREDLVMLPEAGFVRDALQGDVRRCEQNVLHLLSCLHPPSTVAAVRHGLYGESADARAQALEILDNLLEPEIKGCLIALLDELGPDERLTALDRYFPQPGLGASERLGKLLDSRSPAGLFTRLCALYLVGLAGLRSLKIQVAPLLEDPLEVVRETARWSQARL